MSHILQGVWLMFFIWLKNKASATQLRCVARVSWVEGRTAGAGAQRARSKANPGTQRRPKAATPKKTSQ